MGTRARAAAAIAIAIVLLSLADRAHAASCSNAIRDGDETGVDCGGTCPACPGCGCISNGDSGGALAGLVLASVVFRRRGRRG